MSKQIVVMAGLATLATALAGCGTSPRTAANTAALTTAVVALPVQTAPNWFFPVLASTGFTDTNSQMNFLMYKPLVYITKSDGVDYHRSIAASITPNAQGTRYLITLNSRYRWSNGQPVTAQDVVFTWNVMKAASGSGNTPWTYGGAGGGGVPKDWQSVTAQSSGGGSVKAREPRLVYS